MEINQTFIKSDVVIVINVALDKQNVLRELNLKKYIYIVNCRCGRLESSSVAQYADDTGHNINIKKKH